MSERNRRSGVDRFGLENNAKEEATQHLYTARSLADAKGGLEADASPWMDDPVPDAGEASTKQTSAYTPNDEWLKQASGYVPGGARPKQATAYTPNEWSKQTPVYTPNEVSPKPSPANEAEDDWPSARVSSKESVEEDWDTPPSHKQAGAVFTSAPSFQYRRPGSAQGEEGLEEARENAAFAPPLRFETPHAILDPFVDMPMPDAQKRNVYQPRQVTWAATGRMDTAALREQYRVEETRDKPRKSLRRKKRARRRAIAVVCVLAALGIGAYVGKDWIIQQIALLTGAEQVNTASHDTNSLSVAQVKGYDAAPETHISAKAQTGIAAVSGTIPMENVAVTTSNVVVRSPCGAGMFDYYLFAAADGRLLGYYEGLGAADFIVQPNDTFYVRQAPYLLDNQGKALVNTSVYQQNVGSGAVLGPLEHGWAILRDQTGAKANYINAEGTLLSALWFCRAIPFWDENTLAYVDTGNMAKPEERYALYKLSADGTMERWQYAANTTGVVDAACDVALMDNGDLVRLSDLSVLCQASEVTAYLDCGAAVVRDRDTGKYGLFVGGEQHYDFVYDRIAPMQCDIQWEQSVQGAFVRSAVVNAAYPQPLSHYFVLEKEGGQEQVALSTRSCCPVLMN